jgi:hypothetical protein
MEASQRLAADELTDATQSAGRRREGCNPRKHLMVSLQSIMPLQLMVLIWNEGEVMWRR